MWLNNWKGSDKYSKSKLVIPNIGIRVPLQVAGLAVQKAT